MRFLRLFVLVLPLFLAACGLTEQQKADYAQVERSGVNSAVYDKMVHGDDLSLYDVKALSRAGVSDAIVLRYLRHQRTIYYLSSLDVGSLRKAGVSPSIVDFMLQTPRLYTNYEVAMGSGFYIPYYNDYWGPLYPYYPYPHRHWH